MIGVTYEPADKTDVAAIAALHVASWRDAYRSILDPDFLAGPIEDDRYALWSSRLADPPSDLLVETARDRSRHVIGFVASLRDHDPRWGSLVDNLHVRPDMRGRGIGEHLLRSAARRLEAAGAAAGVHLWVFEENRVGLRFYQRLGGTVVERDTSQIPASYGKVILRIHWAPLSALGRTR